MSRPSQLIINLSAVEHNARCLTAKGTAQGAVMAVLKANAYGHGSVAIAKAISPYTQGIAVAFIDEAITLRDAGITLPILALEGPFHADEIRLFDNYNVWPVIHQQRQLEWLEGYGKHDWPSIWLKIDSGMHRLGLPPEEATDVELRCRALSTTAAVWMSHLAIAEQPTHELTQRQLRHCTAAFGSRPHSVSNSAGALLQLAPGEHWQRIGYALYGAGSLHPPGATLQPVMSLMSVVSALRAVPKGDTVGYGGRWEAKRNSVIATIPVGYADGYPRHAKDGTPVLVGDRYCPLAGTVSMDMITVDVTDHPAVALDMPVELWGHTLSVDIVAEHADTIGYELLAAMPERLPKHYRRGATQSPTTHSDTMPNQC